MNDITTRSDSQQLSNPNTTLVKYEAMRQAIDQCRSIDEVKDIRNKAESLRLYTKQAGEGLEMQNKLAEIKLRAERKAGELLAEMDMNKGTVLGGNTVLPPDETPTLADLGIGKMQSSRWQSIAQLSEPVFEKFIAKELAKKNTELTSNGALRLVKKQKGEERNVALAARGSEIETSEEFTILTGDMSVLEAVIQDETVDLFFTDPPYHADKTDLFGRLAELANRKLKPGGFCITYTGQMHLPDVLAGMSEHLVYWWIFAVKHSGGHLQIWNRKVWNDWKPLLVFAKRNADGSMPTPEDWVMDFTVGGGRSKDFHAWGQDAGEATYWLDKLSPPGGLVCDPFVGGGSIPVACKLSGRRFIGSEIDETNANVAKARVYDCPSA